MLSKNFLFIFINLFANGSSNSEKAHPEIQGPQKKGFLTKMRYSSNLHDCFLKKGYLKSETFLLLSKKFKRKRFKNNLLKQILDISREKDKIINTFNKFKRDLQTSMKYIKPNDTDVQEDEKNKPSKILQDYEYKIKDYLDAKYQKLKTEFETHSLLFNIIQNSSNTKVKLENKHKINNVSEFLKNLVQMKKKIQDIVDFQNDINLQTIDNYKILYTNLDEQGSFLIKSYDTLKTILWQFHDYYDFNQQISKEDVVNQIIEYFSKNKKSLILVESFLNLLDVKKNILMYYLSYLKSFTMLQKLLCKHLNIDKHNVVIEYEININKFF